VILSRFSTNQGAEVVPTVHEGRRTAHVKDGHAKDGAREGRRT